MKPHDNPQDTSLIYDAVVFESLNICNNSDKLNYKPLNFLLQEGMQSTLSLEIKSPFVGSPTIEQYSAEDNESCSIVSDYTKTVAEETLQSQDVANVSSKRNELGKKATSVVITHGEYSRDLIKCSGLTQNVTNNQEHAATSIKLSSSLKRGKSPSKNNVSETKTSRYCLCKGSKSELENIKFEDLVNMVAHGEKLFCDSKKSVKTYSKKDISNKKNSLKNLDPCSSNDISKNYESRKKAPKNLLKPLRPEDISKISEKQKKLLQKMNKPYVACYRYKSDTEHLSSDDKETRQYLQGSTNTLNNSKESFDSKLDPLKHPEEINATTSTNFSEVSATTITVQNRRCLSYDVSDQDRCCSVDCCCGSASCTLQHSNEYWQQSTNTSNRSSKDPSITNQASSTTPQLEQRLMVLSLLDNDSVNVPRNTSASNIIISSREYPSKTEQREKSKTSFYTSNRFFKDPSINQISQLTHQASSTTPKFEESLTSSSFLDTDSVSVSRNTSASIITFFSEDYPSKTEQREKSKTSTHYSIDEQSLRQRGDNSVSKKTKYFNKFLKPTFDKFNNPKESFDSKLDPLKHPATLTDLSKVSATTITVQTQKCCSVDCDCSKTKVFKEDERVQTCRDSASCTLQHPNEYWHQSRNTSNRFFKDPSINQISQLTNQDSSRTQQFEKRSMASSFLDNDSVSVSRNTSASIITFFSEDYPSKTEQREKSKTSTHYSIDEQSLRQRGDKSVSKKTKYFNQFLKPRFADSNKKHKRHCDCVQGKVVDNVAYDSSAIDQLQQKFKGLERTLMVLLKNGTNQDSSKTPQFEERLMASSFLDNDAVSVPRNTSPSNIIIFPEDYSSKTNPREKAKTSSHVDKQPLRQGGDKSVSKKTKYFNQFLKPPFADSNNKKKRYCDGVQGKFVDNVAYDSSTIDQLQQKFKGLERTLMVLLKNGTKQASSKTPQFEESLMASSFLDNDAVSVPLNTSPSNIIIFPEDYSSKTEQREKSKTSSHYSIDEQSLRQGGDNSVSKITKYFNKFLKPTFDKFTNPKEIFDSKLDPLKHPATLTDLSKVSATTITVQTQKCCSVDCDCSKRIVFKEGKHVQTCCDAASCTLQHPNEYWHQSTNTSNRSSKDPSINQIKMSKKTKYFNKFLKLPFADSNKMNKRSCDCVQGKFADYPTYDSSAIDQLQQKVKGLEGTLKDLLENSNLPQQELRLAMHYKNCTSKNNNIPSKQMEQNESNSGSYNKNLADDKTLFKNFISFFPSFRNNNDNTKKTNSQTVMTSKTMLPSNVQNNKGTTMYTNQNMQTLKPNSTKNNTSSFQPKQNEIRNVGRQHKNPSGYGHTIILPPNYFGKIPKERNSKPVKKENKRPSKQNDTASLKVHRQKTELKDLKALTKKCIKMLRKDCYYEGRINNNPFGDQKRENRSFENCENYCGQKFHDLEINRKSYSEIYDRDSRGNFVSDNLYNRRNFEKGNKEYRENPDNHDMNNKRLYENSDRDYKRNFENHDMYNRRSFVLNNEDYRENPDNDSMNYKTLSENFEWSSRGSHRGSFESYDMYNRRNSEKNNEDYREIPDNYSMNHNKLSENPYNRSRGSPRESFESYYTYKENTKKNNKDYRENSENHSMNYNKLSEVLESRCRGSHRGSFENYDTYNRRNSEKNNEDYRENPDNHSMNYKKLSETPYNRSRGSPRESFKTYYIYNTKNSEKHYGIKRYDFENHETDNKRNSRDCACYKRNFANHDRKCRRCFENHDMYNRRNSETNYEDYRENPDNYSRNYKKLSENLKSSSRQSHRGSFENYDMYNRENPEKNNEDYRENPDNYSMNDKQLSEILKGSSRGSFKNYDMYNKENNEKYNEDYRENPDNYSMNDKQISEILKGSSRGSFENYDMYNKENNGKNNEDYRENPDVDYKESLESHMCHRRNFEKRYGDYKEYPDNYKMNNKRLNKFPDRDYKGNFENHVMYNKENSENKVDNHETDNKTNLRKCKTSNNRHFENNYKIGIINLVKSHINLSRNLKDDKNGQVDKNIDHQNAVNDQGALKIIDSSTTPSTQSKWCKRWCYGFLRGKKAAKKPEDSEKSVETVPKPSSTDNVKLLSSDDKNYDHQNDLKAIAGSSMTPAKEKEKISPKKPKTQRVTDTLPKPKQSTGDVRLLSSKEYMKKKTPKQPSRKNKSWFCGSHNK